MNGPLLEASIWFLLQTNVVKARQTFKSLSKEMKLNFLISINSSFTFCIAVWRFHVLSVITSVILINLFDFYFATRVHFIERNSILVQRKLISLLTNDDGATLLLMKETSMELWLLSELLNERFEYTLLFTTTTKLIIFVIDIYWVYVRVIHFEHFNIEFISMCNKSSFFNCSSSSTSPFQTLSSYVCILWFR